MKKWQHKGVIDLKHFLSFSGEINSVALYLYLTDLGIDFEAIFANHGGDYPHTYDYVSYFNTELKKRGLIPVTVLSVKVREKSMEKGLNLYDYCDSHKSYVQFAHDFSLDHKRVKRRKHKERIYHIQHINAVHSKLKKWMNRFNGVATKYISNYMYWFKWLELFENDKDAVKVKNFMIQSNVAYAYTKITDFKQR